MDCPTETLFSGWVSLRQELPTVIEGSLSALVGMCSLGSLVRLATLGERGVAD